MVEPSGSLLWGLWSGGRLAPPWAHPPSESAWRETATTMVFVESRPWFPVRLNCLQGHREEEIKLVCLRAVLCGVWPECEDRSSLARQVLPQEVHDPLVLHYGPGPQGPPQHTHIHTTQCNQPLPGCCCCLHYTFLLLVPRFSWSVNPSTSCTRFAMTGRRRAKSHPSQILQTRPRTVHGFCWWVFIFRGLKLCLLQSRWSAKFLSGGTTVGMERTIKCGLPCQFKMNKSVTTTLVSSWKLDNIQLFLVTLLLLLIYTLQVHQSPIKKRLGCTYLRTLPDFQRSMPLTGRQRSGSAPVHPSLIPTQPLLLDRDCSRSLLIASAWWWMSTPTSLPCHLAGWQFEIAW